MTEETIVLAGGSFLGLQNLLGCRNGVVRSRVGFVGGTTEDPSEDFPGDHVQAVELVFDTYVTNLREILEYFFQVHDPTTLDRQGNDVGSIYRSAIFCTQEVQRSIAEFTIGDMEKSGRWPGPFTTAIEMCSFFWPAREEQQDYLSRMHLPNDTHYARPEWVLDDRQEARKPF